MSWHSPHWSREMHRKRCIIGFRTEADDSNGKAGPVNPVKHTPVFRKIHLFIRHVVAKVPTCRKPAQCCARDLSTSQLESGGWLACLA